MLAMRDGNERPSEIRRFRISDTFESEVREMFGWPRRDNGNGWRRRKYSIVVMAGGGN